MLRKLVTKLVPRPCNKDYKLEQYSVTTNVRNETQGKEKMPKYCLPFYGQTKTQQNHLHADKQGKKRGRTQNEYFRSTLSHTPHESITTSKHNRTSK